MRLKLHHLQEQLNYCHAQWTSSAIVCKLELYSSTCQARQMYPCTGKGSRSICLPACLSVCLSVRPSVCLYVCLSVCVGDVVAQCMVSGPVSAAVAFDHQHRLVFAATLSGQLQAFHVSGDHLSLW